MIQATVDVNVLVSALIGPLGFSRKVLAAWEEGRLILITAAGIVTEVDQKLRLSRISKRLPHPDEDREWIIRLLQTQAEMILVPPHECATVTGDPEDDYVLATARLGKADYLVTGDGDLLDLTKYHGIKIVSPREFLEILGKE